eukprot:TRINITY_DN7651_c0_g1_i2.p1 TRINITY_DN7651_c0_g1~~TRINITY_DN7651_c0_g1_i2.p1  ORF type:complete len:180 (+),score=76.71 TRINITY_DN7651_c0_g1_i2:410-949(+)
MGGEFRASAHEALRMGAGVHLGDRDISITLLRTWAALSLFERIKLAYMLLYTSVAGLKISKEDIEEMKNQDVMDEMMESLAYYFPSVSTPLIRERDLYLAASVRRAASEMGEGPVVMAVVGLGHKAGMEEHWDDDISLEELRTLPPHTPSIKKFVLGFVAAHLALVVGAVGGLGYWWWF